MYSLFISDDFLCPSFKNNQFGNAKFFVSNNHSNIDNFLYFFKKN